MAEEAAKIEKTIRLIPEPQRTQYIQATLTAVAEAIKQVAQQPAETLQDKIIQAQQAQQLLNEIAHEPKILAATLHTIKQEWHSFYVNLAKTIYEQVKQ